MTGDRPAATDVNAVIDAHERSGYRLAVGGVDTFVLDLGDGQPVVCLHGVPASSFLYRKLIVELAARGLRGIAFDLPGLGLAERPTAFDYTWTGLGRYASAAVEALALDQFHLVVHDIGGPVGFELAAADPGRVASLTVLNAPVEVPARRSVAGAGRVDRRAGPAMISCRETRSSDRSAGTMSLTRAVAGVAKTRWLARV